MEHPKKAATAVANPDGSRYGDHKMELHEWEIVRQSLYILDITTGAIDLLQTTSTTTAGIILPVVGNLVNKLQHDARIKYKGETVKIDNHLVIEARKELCAEVENRYVIIFFSRGRGVRLLRLVSISMRLKVHTLLCRQVLRKAHGL